MPLEEVTRGEMYCAWLCCTPFPSRLSSLTLAHPLPGNPYIPPPTTYSLVAPPHLAHPLQYISLPYVSTNQYIPLPPSSLSSPIQHMMSVPSTRTPLPHQQQPPLILGEVPFGNVEHLGRAQQHHNRNMTSVMGHREHRGGGSCKRFVSTCVPLVGLGQDSRCAAGCALRIWMHPLRYEANALDCSRALRNM